MMIETIHAETHRHYVHIAGDGMILILICGFILAVLSGAFYASYYPAAQFSGLSVFFLVGMAVAALALFAVLTGIAFALFATRKTTNHILEMDRIAHQPPEPVQVIAPAPAPVTPTQPDPINSQYAKNIPALRVNKADVVNDLYRRTLNAYQAVLEVYASLKPGEALKEKPFSFRALSGKGYVANMDDWRLVLSLWEAAGLGQDLASRDDAWRQFRPEGWDIARSRIQSVFAGNGWTLHNGTLERDQ